MQRKLIVTLSTVHGSRQITLSQITRYFVLLMLIVAGVSFALSYYLLFRTSQSLENLEGEYSVLNSEYENLNYELDQVSGERDLIKARYDVAMGSQRLYLSELDSLNDRLLSISKERENLLEQTDALNQKLNVLGQVEEQKDQLEEQKVQLEDENLALSIKLGDLSASLGLGELRTDQTLEQQADWLEAAARERLYMMHAIPNGSPGQDARITSRYGPRVNPVTGKSTVHRGIDFRMDVGTPVFATADGIVESAGKDNNGGFGKIVRIQHSFGFRTYYAHLSKVLVKAGQYVKKGDQIALSGNTGRSTGPHLHYEVRRLWTSMDPEPFMNWALSNFEQLFDEVEEVDWESLGKLYPLHVARKG